MGLTKQQREEQQIVDTISSLFPSYLNGVPLVAATNDPPDFLGSSETGQQIGLELTSWLDHVQTKDAEGRRRMREELLGILVPEEHPRPMNIASVVITPKWGKVVPKANYQALCDEFHAVIRHFDAALSALKAAHWRPLGKTDRFDYEAHQRDLKPYPTLSKYVESIWFNERFASDTVWEDRAWASVLPDGGLYDPRWARQALARVIEKKISHYREEATKSHLDAQKLSKLYLLVYAHPELFGTNTSYQTGGQMAVSPVEGLAEVASAATSGVRPGVFDAIFLFYPVWNSRWLAQIWPSFLRIDA